MTGAGSYQTVRDTWTGACQTAHSYIPPAPGAYVSLKYLQSEWMLISQVAKEKMVEDSRWPEMQNKELKSLCLQISIQRTVHTPIIFSFTGQVFTVSTMCWDDWQRAEQTYQVPYQFLVAGDKVKNTTSGDDKWNEGNEAE